MVGPPSGQPQTRRVQIDAAGVPKSRTPAAFWAFFALGVLLFGTPGAFAGDTIRLINVDGPAYIFVRYSCNTRDLCDIGTEAISYLPDHFCLLFALEHIYFFLIEQGPAQIGQKEVKALVLKRWNMGFSILYATLCFR